MRLCCGLYCFCIFLPDGVQDDAEGWDFSLSAPSNTPLLLRSGQMNLHSEGKYEGIITGRLKLICAFICNSLKSRCMQTCSHSHLSFGWNFGCLQRDGGVLERGSIGHMSTCVCNVVTPHCCGSPELPSDLHRAWGLSSKLVEWTTETHHPLFCYLKYMNFSFSVHFNELCSLLSFLAVIKIAIVNKILLLK